jgi:protocatechuate 3,4-dioxygenase beta subunit
MFVQKLWTVLLLIAYFQQAHVPSVSGLSASSRTPATSPTFRISGKVIDAITGQPLARASVSVNPPNSPNTPNPPDSGRLEITDDEGVFAFTGLPPGKYVLSARHRGYVAQMYQQHEFFTTAIIVGPGLQSENLIFGLRPAASISGVVDDESGDPVRHASVLLYRQLFNGGRRRTVQMGGADTNDEGYYHFGHLDPGTYFVAVSAQPWYAQHARTVHVFTKSSDDPVTREILQPIAEQNQALDVVYPIAFYSNAGDLQGATPISLHSGDTAIADFRMRPVPSMHFLVRTPAPDSEQNMGVSVTQTVTESSTIWVPAQVNPVAPGLIEVTGVPQGRFNLVLNSQRGSTATRRSQSVQIENDSDVDVTRTSSSVVVSGVLRIEDGSPVPQPARVRLVISANGGIFDTAVSATGEFSFKDNPVEPGNYEIVIIEPQALFIRNLTSENAKTSGRSFQIATAQDVSLRIHASKGNGRVTGVALQKDKPASGVMIVLAPLDSKSNPALFRRDQSDSDGSFVLNVVVPGRYTLMAIEDGWDLEWGDPAVLQKYLAGGESVLIAPNEKIDVKVKVQ